MIYTEYLFVCIVAPLGAALLFLEGESRKSCGFLIAGITVCLLSAYANGFLMGQMQFSVSDAAVYISPITEEILKFCVVFFYFIVFEPEDEQLLAAAVMVGIGFATFENICYLLYGNAEKLSYTLIRGFSAGIMHTVCALAMGLGLTLFRYFRKYVIAGIMGIFALSVTYHAVYNLLVSAEGYARLIGYVLPASTIIVIYLFRHYLLLK